MVKFFRENINFFIFLVISGWGLYLRFITLRGRELWGDEIYQFHCMAGAFKPFWLKQTYGDFSSFPGEYLLSYFGMHWFGMNKWGLAIPHILITVLGFFLLYKIGRYYFRSWVGYCVAFSIMAFNADLIFHSFEFRPYAVLPVMALACLLLAHKFVEGSQNWGKVKTCLIGLLIIVIINYHMYGAAIFLLPLLYVMLINFIQRGKVWMMPAAFWPFIFFAFCLWIYYAFSTDRKMISTMGQGIFQYIPNFIERPWDFVRTILSDLMGFKKGHFLVNSIIISIFLPGIKKLEQFLFLSILIILPILLILYGDLANQYWFLSRQFVWVMPWYAVFLGWQWDAIYGFIKLTFRKYFLTKYLYKLE